MNIEMDDNEIDINTLETLYARTIFTLRESRKEVLKRYGVDDETAILEKIKCGELDEHPAYEHYLSALIVEQTRMHVRAQAVVQLGGQESDDATPASVHLMLKEQIEERYAGRLSEPVRMAQDALLLAFDTGLMVEARYFSKDEYSIGWSWGEAVLRIDTAPVHGDSATFPHHRHDDEGGLYPDVVTSPGGDCWLNFSRLLDALLVNPMLDTAELSK